MKTNKILALFLALLMVVGSIPLTMQSASAAPSGTGTTTDPYQIWTADDLNNVRNDLNAYYILCNDIDLSAYPNWVPLGDVQNPFTGRLNGNNHTISGLKIGSAGAPSTAYSHTGLFGYINQYGVVHDLGVDVAIYNNSGYASGGIAGKSEGYLVNCHTSGTLVSTAFDSNTGGIVGENAGNLVNCYNTANITGGSCKALDVIGIGGIAGINTGENGITNCYNAGIVSDSEGEKLGKTGAIVGYSDHGFVRNCYWDRELCPIIRGGYNTGGYIKSGGVLGLVTNAMKGAAIKGTEYIFDITGKKTVIDGTFADLMNQGRGAISPEQLPSGVKASAWGQDNGNVNNGYPVFTKASTSGVFSGGSGIITDPYIIKTQEQLQNIKNNTVPYTLVSPLPDVSGANTFFMGGYYQLANDIDITEPFLYCDVIGHCYNYSGFNGEFDGNGYCIKFTEGLTMDIVTKSGSLFYLIGRYGVVKNLAIECEDTSLISGFAFANCGLIANCRITGTIDRKDDFHSSAICAINAGDIINCYSSADVTAYHDAGGICKNLNGGVIANSCTTGNVYSRAFGASGVVVQPLDWLGIGVINCYTAGNITADKADAYGVHGFMSYSSSVGYINCYWNSSATQVEAGKILSPTRGYEYGGYECDTNSLPIGVSSEVMKGQNASIEYSDAPNDTSDKKIAQSFLEALNRGRRAVGEDFYWESAPYDQPGFYPVLLHQEELYPWVYVSGVNNDYPIPFKPQTPNITIQPSGKTITSGNTLTFHTAAAEVRDGGTLSYQWQKSTDGASWINVTDGTGGGSNTYTTGTLSTGNSNEKYRCVITNTRYGITTSIATDVAVVTVKPSLYPLNPTVEAGNAITFGVDGAGPYQWQVSTDFGSTWNNITGATLSYYATDALNSGNNGSLYRCIVNGTATDASTVTVTTGTVNVTGVTVTPSIASIQKGSTYTFGAAVLGINNSQNVTWSVEGASSTGTGISSGGVLTVATDETGTLTVRATSVDNTSISGTASVTLTEIPATVSSVTITPGTATVIKGGSSFTFSAAVAGTHNPSQAVTWRISGNNSPGTAISPVGELIVAANETVTALTVTAVSNIDSSKFGTATVTVTSPTATVSDVTVTPNIASVPKGSTYTFSAAVNGTNSPSQTVSWSVSGNNHANTIINGSGVLAVAAGETATSLTVIANSAVSSTVSGSAIVAVTDAVSTDPTVDAVTINPPSTSVVKGNNISFAAVVTGSNSPAQTVTWQVYGGTSSGTVISSSGHLTVDTNETATTLTVMVKSTVDSSKFATAAVTVTSPVVSISNVTVTPNAADIAKGSTYTFSAEVTGTNNPSQAVSWSVSGNSKPGTMINSAGMLAIATGETAATLTVTATSVLDGTKSGTSTVTVTETGSDSPTVDGVMVNPATTSAEKGGTKAFTATVTGSNSPAQTVTWSVSGNNSAGTTISNGLLTVGADETAVTITVQAVSTIDNTKSGTAAVTVTGSSLPAPTVSSVILSTTGSNVNPGGTKTFTATVTGTNNPSQEVTWSVSGNSSHGTTISSSGVLTIASNETATSLTVTATSVLDTTKSGTEAITVAPLVTVSAVTVSPSNGSVQAGGTKTFTAAVEGTNNPSQNVTWSVSGNTSVNTIISNGVLTTGSNETAGTLTVKAASTIDSTKYGTATVTVTQANPTNPNTGNGGGGGGGGSFASPSSNDITPTVLPEKKPDQPVSTGVNITATVDKTGIATAIISESSIINAITKAQAEAKTQDKTENGISIAVNAKLPDTAKSTGIVLTQPTLKALIDAEAKQLEINGIPAYLSFDLAALMEIQKQSSAEVTLSIIPVTVLTGNAKKLIGNRAVYNISLSYRKDGKTMNITSLGSGSVTLSIPYTPGKKETAGYLFGVYVDGHGKASRIQNSTYDANSNSIIFDSNHFSVYGVGYTAPSEKFTDVSTHWAKEYIDYVVGRGLLSGTSITTFSPDTSMSRGMLVTALGRMAGVNVSSYKTGSFTDVDAEEYYAPYIEWAYKNGVTSDVDSSRFAPDRAVTREEISLILSNYAKATGYTLPVTREAAAYADANSIDSTFKDAVQAMQQAGIMMGGNDNKFNPNANATRAEVSAMLTRYVKLTIDPDTAQGWALNDAGQRMYYKDGKALIGWQTIGGKKYLFDNDGAMLVGWKKENGSRYYLTANGALTGWQDIGSGDKKNRYYFTADAIMVYGRWLKIDGKRYYFKKDGTLAVNTKIDGYEVDENGARKTK